MYAYTKYKYNMHTNKRYYVAMLREVPNISSTYSVQGVYGLHIYCTVEAYETGSGTATSAAGAIDSYMLKLHIYDVQLSLRPPVHVTGLRILYRS